MDKPEIVQSSEASAPSVNSRGDGSDAGCDGIRSLCRCGHPRENHGAVYRGGSLRHASACWVANGVGAYCWCSRYEPRMVAVQPEATPADATETDDPRLLKSENARLLAALDASAATERDLRARLAQAEHPKRVAALYEVLAEARDLLGRRNLDGSLNVERQRVALLVAAVASFDEIDAALASTKETP